MLFHLHLSIGKMNTPDGQSHFRLSGLIRSGRIPPTIASHNECEKTMKNFSSTDQDYNLWVLLAQTRHAMIKARSKELDRYNITTRQSALLFTIQAIGDKATPAEIARWLFRETHTVSELLSRMERKGLVRKVKGLDRKNLVRVVLTEKGRKAYYQSIEGKVIRKIMSSLSREQRQQLTSCLHTLRDNALKELGVEHKMPFPSSQ